MNILLGLLLIGAWSAAVYYSKKLEKWFGRWQWAESNLWGTAQAYVLMWFGMIVLWVMSLFGVVKLS
jgi:hypothetical protein